MALSAINDFVLALQDKAGAVMVKKYGVCGNLPILRGMTSVATYLKILSMWRLAVGPPESEDNK
jgi:hypothetical protein